MKNNLTTIGTTVQGDWMPTRAEIQRITDTLVEQVCDGNVSVVKSVTILTALLESLDGALKRLKQDAVDELHKYPKGQQVTVNGADIQLKEAGVRYDYSNCGDTILLDMINERDELDNRIKDRQKFLRSIKDVEMVVDTRTGELCELRPPTKTSTTTFTIKYPDGI